MCSNSLTASTALCSLDRLCVFRLIAGTMKIAAAAVVFFLVAQMVAAAPLLAHRGSAQALDLESTETATEPTELVEVDVEDKVDSEAEAETEVDTNAFMASMSKAEGTVAGFTQTAASVDVRYAAVAYCALANPTSLKAWKCQLCKQVPKITDMMVFSIATCRGYVGYDATKKRIMVSFSGTPPKSILTLSLIHI